MDDTETAPLIPSTSHLATGADQRTPLQRKLAVYPILLSAGFERLAFYSLVGNLTFFLDSHLIQWNFPHTVIVPLIFLGKSALFQLLLYSSISCAGTSYISALLFSCISDGRLGRAKTIIIGKTVYPAADNPRVFRLGFVLYSIGYTLLVLFSNEHIHGSWCPISSNGTISEPKDFFNELCIQYILPILIITYVGIVS